MDAGELTLKNLMSRIRDDAMMTAMMITRDYNMRIFFSEEGRWDDGNTHD